MNGNNVNIVEAIDGIVRIRTEPLEQKQKDTESWHRTLSIRHDRLETHVGCLTVAFGITALATIIGFFLILMEIDVVRELAN